MLHGSGDPSGTPDSSSDGGVVVHRYIEITEELPDTKPMRWDFFDLANRIGQTLQEAEDALRLEQAVYGLDSLDDLRLHQLLVRGLSRWYMAQRQAPFPSAISKKRVNRPRCDLVLTPPGRPLKTTEEPDLFTPPDACAAEDALWLAIKSARQFQPAGVAPEAHGVAWRNAIVDDLKKIAADPRIQEGGLLLIAFSESEEVLARDLELFEDHLIRSHIIGAQSPTGLEASYRHVRTVRISERMGHRTISAALWPSVQRGPGH